MPGVSGLLVIWGRASLALALLAVSLAQVDFFTKWKIFCTIAAAPQQNPVRNPCNGGGSKGAFHPARLVL
jgi:hypothetical protein